MTPHGHGWQLDRARFDAMLAVEATAAGATLLRSARLVSIERSGDGWLARVAPRGREPVALRAAFVVDATGRKASIAASLGATQRFDDDLAAVYCFGLDDNPSEQTRSTLIEAAPDGWWYTAFLPGRRLATAFLTDGDIVKKKRLLSLQRWIELLGRTRHTREHLRDCRAGTRLRAYRAHSRLLDPIAGDRWLAAGDAAASYDPLSSMGIGNALNTGMHAARAIDAALNGNAALLEEYARAVRSHYETYRAMQRRFYCLEQRWSEEPFWRRRHADPVVS